MENEPSSDEEEIAPPILQHVPPLLRIAGAWSWRLIVVGVVIMAILSVLATLAPIVIPVAVAVLIAAPLERVVTMMEHFRIPRGLGAISIVLGLIVSVLGLTAVASTSVVSSLGNLRDKANSGLDTVIAWLADGPFHMSEEQIQDFRDRATETLGASKSGVISKTLSLTSQVGALTAGAVIALFCLFFFLKEGRSLWLQVVSIVPERSRARVDYAAIAAWRMLAAYTKTSVFVAFVDATGIGLAAFLLGSKLALPIAILVFLTSFLPLIGATISGSVAVLVILVETSWVRALVMVGCVVIVQFVEGNVLYPWLFGRATAMHPVAILLTIGSGTLIAGIPGAFFAVPIVALIKTFFDALRRTGLGPTTEIDLREMRAILDSRGGQAVQGPKSAKEPRLRRARPRRS
ncbi:MAG: AI-2E family transporter [Demequinaceae bacterium]|nr:AI-2E family transporter [Demequinaceae bacterium]